MSEQVPAALVLSFLELYWLLFPIVIAVLLIKPILPAKFIALIIY